MPAYQKRDLVEPSFLQRLFKQIPKKNSIIEINNILEKHEKNIKQVSLDDILKISEKYKINIKRKFKQKRLEMFSEYLTQCLLDKKLEKSGLDTLRHLRHILLLNENDTQTMLKQKTEELYQHEINAAVADGIMTSVEKENLERIKNDLLIPNDVAENIYKKTSTELLKKFIDNAISDERLSAEEEIEMNRIAKSLNIELNLTVSSKVLLDKYRLFWQIENSDLPELASEIKTQESEKLHFQNYVSWFEQGRATKRIIYGGLTLKIKIGKGGYWRSGYKDMQSISTDTWERVDQGKLYVTNKRLIFMGVKSNKNIKLNKILDLMPYKNGVAIQKDSGKSFFLSFYKNIDIFSMILARLLDEL